MCRLISLTGGTETGLNVAVLLRSVPFSFSDPQGASTAAQEERARGIQHQRSLLRHVALELSCGALPVVSEFLQALAPHSAVIRSAHFAPCTAFYSFIPCFDIVSACRATPA